MYTLLLDEDELGFSDRKSSVGKVNMYSNTLDCKLEPINYTNFPFLWLNLDELL